MHQVAEKSNQQKKSNTIGNTGFFQPLNKSADIKYGNTIQRKCPIGECEEEKENIQNPKGRSGLFFQPKLAVSSPNDQYEQEADRVADEVMRMKDNEVLQRKPSAINIQRKYDESEGEEDKIQRKEGKGKISPDANVLISEVINSPGKPLDKETRKFMEPRFGYDFSKVRVYDSCKAAESARSINALAYTIGNKLIFNKNQYLPETNSGKRLLAHELTHIVQQKQSMNKIQRMVAVNKGVKLNNLGLRLTEEVVGNKIHYSKKTINKSSVQDEIVSGLFHSKRIFKIMGKESNEAINNIMEHVIARLGVIEFANKSKYYFAAVTNMKMNRKFWTVTKKGHHLINPDVKNKQEALDDLLNPHHRGEYFIPCYPAAQIAMVGGGKSPYYGESAGDKNDWIPGDWGEIKNTKYPRGGSPELAGQNIIYMGLDKYWGHNPGEKIRTMKEWMEKVAGWNGGAELCKIRKYPTIGLEIPK